MKKPASTEQGIDKQGTTKGYVMTVYLDDGTSREQDIDTFEEGRAKADAIAIYGYQQEQQTGQFEHFPPHRILKVSVSGRV